jgi:hypothetical protein
MKTALANDSAVAFENGSIVFKEQPEISMEKESLFISDTEVKVEYLFRNTGPRDLNVTIAFPMPPIYYGASDYSHIKNFKLFLDGVEKETKKKLVILLDNRIDITEKMASFGWSVQKTEEFLEGSWNQKEKLSLPGSFFDQYGEPRFTINEYYFWEQKFPTGKNVSIRHSYKPSIETGVPRFSDEIIGLHEKISCIDQKTKSNIKKYAKNKNDVVDWRNIRYILTTANNWQGPIKDFTLTIKKSKPSQIVSLCFDGDFKKKDPMTFEFHQKDFKPTSDLNLLLIDQLE